MSKSSAVDEQFPVDRTRDALLAALSIKDVKSIVAMFSANMRAALPADKLACFVDGILTAKGALGAARNVPDAPASARHAAYYVAAERGEWLLDLTVGDDGTILGMSMKNPAPPEPEVRRTKAVFALPFKGEWLVVWGGATEDMNQHVRHRSQRRAADLVVVDADGKTHKSEGKGNGDYYAYGQNVLAARDGKVITAVDGVPDNIPPAMNAYAAFGNFVVLEHAPSDGEPVVYSVYAHLQPSSTKARIGAKVKRGDLVGRCGNSGNSSEPHLHFQLMDGPRVESSFGVEATFTSVMVTQTAKPQAVDGYRFTKGDRVRAIPSSSGPTP